MDNHPIPQDVTGFQFKLIGNMTIKQFGYVAFGVIMSVILYYLPIHFLIKMLLIPIFGGSGFAIAFLPVEGRPIDVMAANFLKALASPNQYIYNKAGRQFSFTAIPSTKASQQNTYQAAATKVVEKPKAEQLHDLLQQTSLHHSDVNQLDAKESSYLKLFAAPAVVPTAATQPAPQPQGQQNMAQLSSVTSQAQNLTQQETQLTQQLAQAKKVDASKPQIDQLERQVQTLHFQRQQLEQQIQQLQAQMQNAAQPQQRVRNIPKDMVRSVGLPHVSDTPNVIVGIVKDSRGNVLSGMLVEVKDKDGNPVRAFKTNQLGQFASATPLATGTYTIELEDPKKQHSFDIIQIEANNQVLLPLEIISHDAREELRKQLFN